jgi:hypothetical protein
VINMSEKPEPDRGYASTSNLIAKVVRDIRATQAGHYASMDVLIKS